MIQANISEVKNRLSYYLRLVKGGDQLEILDRKTPLVRIVRNSSADENGEKSSSWILEARELVLVAPPSKGSVDPKILEEDLMARVGKGKGTGVVDALLEERRNG